MSNHCGAVRGCFTPFSAQAGLYLSKTVTARPSVRRYAQLWEMFGPSGRAAARWRVRQDASGHWVVSDQHFPGCDSLEVLSWLASPDSEGVVAEGNQCVCMGTGGLSGTAPAKPEVDGYCYKDMATTDGRGIPDLGTWPTVAALREARVAPGCGVVEVGRGAYHATSAGDFQLRHLPAAAVVGGVSAAPVLNAASAFDDLRSQPDFSVCKCRVHRAPHSEVGGKVAGCAAKRVGKHSTIAAAAAGSNTFCHAEESTRRKDRGFLSLVAEGPPASPAYMQRDVLPQVLSFESDNSSTVADFGRGYCYLDHVRPRLRWRVARLLGPNPKASDVLRFWQWALMKEFKTAVCEEVVDGFVHVRPAPGVKGVSLDAGQRLYEALQAAVVRDPELRIGADTPLAVMQSLLAEGGFVVTPEELVTAGFSVAAKRASELPGEQKMAKRMLEAVGDAYLTAALAVACETLGTTPQQYQEARSAHTNNAYLAGVFASSGLGRALDWAPADYQGATAAKTYEAFAGVVAKVAGLEGVGWFFAKMGGWRGVAGRDAGEVQLHVPKKK